MTRLYAGIYGEDNFFFYSHKQQDTLKTEHMQRCFPTSIMSNIHSAPISRFPPKELCDIDQHQYSIYKHRISHSPIHFILQT